MRIGNQDVSVIPQNVWTSGVYTTGALTVGPEVTIFSAKLGDTGISLTDTNFKSASKVPYPQFFAYGVQAEILGDGNVGKLPGLDMNAALHGLSLYIKHNDVKIMFAMLHNVPAGNDVTGAIATGSGTTTTIAALNGVASMRNFYPFKKLEIINAADKIEGAIKTEAAWTVATAFKVRITLLGFIAQAKGIGA